MSGTKVWVVLEGGRVELVDSAPLPPERFSQGHFWMFDNFTSDMDAPYTCGLCGEPQWKAYGTPCVNGRTPEDLNADRAQWIADHAFAGEPEWVIRQPVAQVA